MAYTTLIASATIRNCGIMDATRTIIEMTEATQLTTPTAMVAIY
jgi:hypothetical protein